MSFGGDSPPSLERSPSIAIAGAIHDLGNLMQIAASAINLVARAPEMPAVHSGPILARATTSLEQAAEIVRQALGNARESAGLLDDTDVAIALAEVAALIASTEEPGFLVDVAVDSDLPSVRCDPIGLRRSILNLVFNARDAVAGTGVVLIRAENVRRGDSPPQVELRVADNGVGMSERTIARVFDPFFTTKLDGLGGIGLPMVERFAREAGGEVSIDSAEGLGTTVTIRLPAVLRPAGVHNVSPPGGNSEEPHP